MKKIVLTLLLIIGINSFSNYDFGNFLVSALVSEGNLKVYDLECVSMKKKDFCIKNLDVGHDLYKEFQIIIDVSRYRYRPLGAIPHRDRVSI